ncbi:hypothetical protein ER308_10020 [Egibacter rhizosphaerae]|uniref:Uncharacterized protein n=1 Tax=Egibacter rhizosphaerae TaxID=1670831 RepID=A0A411YF62_9ACTN|nr:hypothetical protein [Egibacter rhizosphaerae]QBI19860.1 hypothetical protein ER308_10020 [Egibacter rhizosphaerae]
MTDPRIRGALERRAGDGPDPSEVWVRADRRIVRRRIHRWAGGAASAVVLVGVALAGTAWLLPDRHADVFLGAVGAGDEVTVDNAVLTVPDDWEVHEPPFGSAEDWDGGLGPPLEEPSGRDEDVEAGGPGADDCPDVDPDGFVLLIVDDGPAATCAELLDDWRGLAISPLARVLPSLGTAPRVLTDGEHDTAGTVPAHRVDAPLVTEVAREVPSEPHWSTFLAPGVDVAVEARGLDTAEVAEVLATLQPAAELRSDAVLSWLMSGRDPESEGPDPVLGWAVDGEGRFHVWHEEEVEGREFGASAWPGQTAERFGGLLRTPDEARVIATRADDDESYEYVLGGDDAARVAERWQPDGAAIAWLETGPQPTLRVADWGSPDRLVDGADPDEYEVSLRGDGLREDLGALEWVDRDGDEVLRLFETGVDGVGPREYEIVVHRTEQGTLEFELPTELEGED